MNKLVLIAALAATSLGTSAALAGSKAKAAGSGTAQTRALNQQQLAALSASPAMAAPAMREAAPMAAEPTGATTGAPMAADPAAGTMTTADPSAPAASPEVPAPITPPQR